MNIKNIIILISLYLLIGCSSTGTNKHSGLQKSPCACLDSEFIDVNNKELTNV